MTDPLSAPFQVVVGAALVTGGWMISRRGWRMLSKLYGTTTGRQLERESADRVTLMRWMNVYLPSAFLILAGAATFLVGLLRLLGDRS